MNSIKSKLTQQLEMEIRKNTEKIGIFQCFEVTVNGNERIDFLTYQPTKQIWRCYEIKSSKSDFYSKCKHTFVGQFNYFVMSEDLYEEVQQDIPKHVGCYILESKGGFYCKRNPKRIELQIDATELKENLIRSLFRDANKYVKLVEKDMNEIDKIKREKSSYKSKMNKALKDNREYREQVKFTNKFLRSKGLTKECDKFLDKYIK